MSTRNASDLSSNAWNLGDSASTIFYGWMIWGNLKRVILHFLQVRYTFWHRPAVETPSTYAFAQNAKLCGVCMCLCVCVCVCVCGCVYVCVCVCVCMCVWVCVCVCVVVCVYVWCVCVCVCVCVNSQFVQTSNKPATQYGMWNCQCKIYYPKFYDVLFPVIKYCVQIGVMRG
jgi:hypothetical protein